MQFCSIIIFYCLIGNIGAAQLTLPICRIRTGKSKVAGAIAAHTQIFFWICRGIEPNWQLKSVAV